MTYKDGVKLKAFAYDFDVISHLCLHKVALIQIYILKLWYVSPQVQKCYDYITKRTRKSTKNLFLF